MTKYKQGIFKPRNPHKYRGNPTNIIYRSSWELRAMVYFDKNDDIVEWSSEELFIPYRSPADNRVRRYFPDFLIKTINNEKILIEIKPKIQTLPPEKGKKKKKRYLNEVITYGINKAKWDAAESYCNKKCWRFEILTERELPL